jgi:sortase A
MTSSAMRWVERSLIATGVACLLVYTIAELGAARYREQQVSILAEAIALETPPLDAPASSARPAPKAAAEPAVEEGDAIGLLEIPRLGLSTPILSGEDEQTLKLGAGHLRDTPSPWEEGNSAVAGHRDGVFRPLRNIRVGDRIVLKTRKGNLAYVVADTFVVTPDNLSVLDPTETSVLTLITCYPFNYVGPAPKRFIVRAEREIGTGDGGGGQQVR